MAMAIRKLAVFALVGALFARDVQAQSSDVMWHNRYHALLAMSAYGDYNDKCPQYFTKANQDYYLNLPPWQVLESFGPTPSGAQGYTVVIPEMAKVVIVFKGNYGLEKSLDPSITGFDYLGLQGYCSGCTVNAFAAKGYLEAKAATNNWKLARQHFKSTGLKFSVTGHGLGGMHSLIASIDLGVTNEIHYSHNYGTPRTFNPAGAALYNQLFQGEAAERGVANNDRFVELIPESSDYQHVNSAFLYTGSAQPYGMNWNACWDDPESSACKPLKPLDDASHYFYFTEPGNCGVSFNENYDQVYGYLGSVSKAFAATAAPGATTIPNNYNPNWVNPWSSTPSSSSSWSTSTHNTSTSTSTSTSSSSSSLANSTTTTTKMSTTTSSSTSSTVSSTSSAASMTSGPGNASPAQALGASGSPTALNTSSGFVSTVSCGILLLGIAVSMLL